MSNFLNKLKAKTSLTSTQNQLAQASGQKSYGDDRYWKLDADKNSGVGSAVIRFLPAPDGEDLPFVQIFKHSFKDQKTGKWYIENSLTTIGQQDYIAEENSRLWNSGIEENKKIASSRKRNKKFITNILVVKDSKHPENEGKVFLFELGPKIFGMLETAINPQFDDVEPIDPFCMLEGANFNLRCQKVSGQRNYDQSNFSRQSAISDDEAELERIYNSMHSLKAEIAEDKFKSYEKLKERFLQVTGQNAPPRAIEPTESDYNVAEIGQGTSQNTQSTSNKQADDGDDFEALYAELSE
ncbi:MAG: hypothetical protein RSC93_00135 [Erysipelotrichaceae bacterium]